MGGREAFHPSIFFPAAIFPDTFSRGQNTFSKNGFFFTYFERYIFQEYCLKVSYVRIRFWACGGSGDERRGDGGLLIRGGAFLDFGGIPQIILLKERNRESFPNRSSDVKVFTLRLEYKLIISDIYYRKIEPGKNDVINATQRNPNRSISKRKK